jgi:serine/threonine protein kinase
VRKEQALKGLLKDRYQVLQKIGKGLSGEVYKGMDILSDRLVAIKVSELGNSKESEYEFYKKVQHKNIVNYLNNFT